MSEVLSLEHVALEAGGATLSMVVFAGQSLAVMGPSGSGKSRFLRVIAGEDRPPTGSITLRGSAVLAAGELSRRAKVQSLARRTQVSNPAALATELLIATRLWDVRALSVTELTPGQAAAAELLGPLSQEAGLVLLDGQLDLLDPWTLRSVLDYLHTLRSRGAAVVVATNRPDLVSSFDAVVVLKERHVRFAGSIQDLLRAGPPHRITVGTDDQAGVRALVSPFEVSVTATPDGLRMEAKEGQELAARLLLEGYGDVRFVTVRPPTVEEALLAVLGG